MRCRPSRAANRGLRIGRPHLRWRLRRSRLGLPKVGSTARPVRQLCPGPMQDGILTSAVCRCSLLPAAAAAAVAAAAEAESKALESINKDRLPTRCGWMEIEYPPPPHELLKNKEAPAEWAARWFTITGSTLTVHKRPPQDDSAPKGLFGKKAVTAAPPVHTFDLARCTMTKLPLVEKPEGRGIVFTISQAEDEAKAGASIDDAFSGRPLSAKDDKKRKDEKKEQEKPDGQKPGDPPKRRRHRVRKDRDKELDHVKTKGEGDGPGGKKKSKKSKKGKRPTTPGAVPEAAEPEPEEAEYADEAMVELLIDPGLDEEEYEWWCRALFDGGVLLPELVQNKLVTFYHSPHPTTSPGSLDSADCVHDAPRRTAWQRKSTAVWWPSGRHGGGSWSGPRATPRGASSSCTP